MRGQPNGCSCIYRCNPTTIHSKIKALAGFSVRQIPGLEHVRLDSEQFPIDLEQFLIACKVFFNCLESVSDCFKSIFNCFEAIKKRFGAVKKLIRKS
jgi:hypothetical protein